MPEHAPQGLCPKCLFAGLDVPTEDGVGAAAQVPSQTPEELAPHFPQLEILEASGAAAWAWSIRRGRNR